MDRLHDGLFDERIDPRGGAWADHVARYDYAAGLLPAGARVLDAGTGTGYGAIALGAVGVDGSLTALRAAATHRPGSWVAADVEHLPFRDSAFDVVTCMEVIEHVTRPGALCRELARVVKSDGKVFVSTPSARIELAFDHSLGRERWDQHISPHTPRQLRHALRRSFRNVTVLGQSRAQSLPQRLVKAVDMFGLRFRLGLHRPATPALTGAAEPLGGSGVADERYVFSRWLAYGANQLLAVASR